jgi:putative flippase GtrA
MIQHAKNFALNEGKGMIKFIIVGGVSFLIYSGAYVVLTRWIFTNANLTLMNVLSLCISGVFNFTAHRGWTYRATHSRGRTQIGRYLFVVVSAAVLQAGLFWFCVERLGLPDLIMLVPIAGVCALYTYFAHRWFTFRKPQIDGNVL